MNKMLFLTDYISQDRAKLYFKKSSKNAFSYAGNAYSEKIIYGFLKNKIDFKVLSVPNFGSFPNNNNKIFYFKANFIDKNIYYLSYFNFFGIRNISQFHSLKKAFKKMIKSECFSYVFISEIHTPFLKLAKYIKKRNHNIKIGLIVQDLPQYMDLSNKKRPFYRFLKKIDIFSLEKLYEHVDKYVLLSSNMINFLPNKPYIISNGLISDSKFNIHNFLLGNKILYAGTLNESFGIRFLLESFCKFGDQSLTLLIAGSGELKSLVVDESQKHKNIVYLGVLEKKELDKVCKKVDCFVNPRMLDDYCSVSFPSKVINYLPYCKPIISFKLPCFDQDIANVINFSDFDELSLMSTIRANLFSSKKKALEKGKMINDYVKSHNYVLEISRMINFLLKD